MLRVNWDLKAAVRALLLDDRFRYADATAGRQSVRQPLESSCTRRRRSGSTSLDTRVLPLLQQMGQKPFQPPNVSGWPVGERWLSPTTTIARYDFGVLAPQLALTRSIVGAWPAAADLAAWTRRLGLASLSAPTIAALERYLADQPPPPRTNVRSAWSRCCCRAPTGW